MTRGPSREQFWWGMKLWATLKEGRNKQTSAVELLKQRVEAWILAKKNHIHLELYNRKPEWELSSFFSLSFLFLFCLFCYLVVTYLCNELTGKKTSQSENIVFTMSYTLRRDKEVWDIFLHSRKIDILGLAWQSSG